MLAIAGMKRSLAVMVAALATNPPAAPAQSVSGAMAVSVTVLPPVGAQPPRLVSFSVGRDGVARLVTTAPMARAVSQIVMVTISSSTNGFVPIAQAPVWVMAARRVEEIETTAPSHDARAPRLRYEIDLGPAPLGSAPHDVSVRITHLIVPGT
jgi:hypothetical protein